ncbi:hypothetical protein DITRI_Ditri04bG0020900 [Diplodiscus trichospermus]
MKESKVVMSLYQAPKPSSSVQYSTKVKPISSSGGSMTSASFYIDAYMDDSEKQKQPYVGSDTGNSSYHRVEQFDYDEGIDARAASYISGVRQRFSLERGN